jgi:hypothetical protein
VLNQNNSASKSPTFHILTVRHNMRSELKSDELFAKKHLEKYFISNGIEYRFDESHTDKPDLVFINSEKRIGCELTMLSVEKFMMWTNDKRKLISEHSYRLVIPLEPHMWISKSISDKNKKVENYKINANIDECWLLLHCGPGSHNWFYKDTKLILDCYRYVAMHKKHGFKKILFLYRDKKVYDLTDANKCPETVPILPFDNKGYETIEIQMLTTVLTNKDKTIKLGEIPEAERVLLNFMDPRLKDKN